MQQQKCEAVFENGILRPIGNLQLAEGESVKLIVESHSSPNLNPALLTLIFGCTALLSTLVTLMQFPNNKSPQLSQITKIF